MKLLLLLIVLLSFNTQATEYELSISHTEISQELFGTIKFPMEAAIVRGTAWKDNLGLSLEYGKSTRTANNMYVEDLFYENKINSMYSIIAWYRYPVEKWTFKAGVGITDYKSTWYVNDVKPAWSDGTDSDTSYHAEIQYKYTNNMSMHLGYARYYDKLKKGYGREHTRGLLFGFTYKF